MSVYKDDTFCGWGQTAGLYSDFNSSILSSYKASWLLGGKKKIIEIILIDIKIVLIQHDDLLIWKRVLL